jgi:hypothetical protein
LTRQQSGRRVAFSLPFASPGRIAGLSSYAHRAARAGCVCPRGAGRRAGWGGSGCQRRGGCASVRWLTPCPMRPPLAAGSRQRTAGNGP